jgi:hypothetical protein
LGYCATTSKAWSIDATSTASTAASMRSAISA